MTLTRRLMNINKLPRRIDRNVGGRNKKIIIKSYPKKNYEKKKVSYKKLKPNKMGFRSSVSIYKEKFFDKEITFKPKFSITKNITFANYGKIANNLAKAFKRFKPQKF